MKIKEGNDELKEEISRKRKLRTFSKFSGQIKEILSENSEPKKNSNKIRSEENLEEHYNTQIELERDLQEDFLEEDFPVDCIPMLDNIDAEELGKLLVLVDDSLGKITLLKLNNYGVMKIDRENSHKKGNKGKIEGIYWDGYLGLMGTKIKSLRKIKQVGGDFNCSNMKSLEDLGELEYVGGTLNLVGCSIKLQLEIIKRVKIRGIEVFPLDTKNIEKSSLGKIEVNCLVYDEYIDEIYDENKLQYIEFRRIFGEHVSKIEDKRTKREYIWILQREYNRVKKIAIKKVKKISEENEGKKLTEEEKKKLREKVLEIEKKFKKQMEILGGFGLKLEDL